MVGRATEFRRVVERWKGALEGRGGCVLISGEPGSGKTRLLRELERRLRRDRSLVLTSKCHPVEGEQPLAPFLEMIAEAHAVPGLGGTLPSSLEILAALLPEIAQQFRGAIRPRQPPIPPEAVAGALLDAFAPIAEEVPLAILAEDLHWASPVTIAFAHRLARRADRAALLLILSANDVARTVEKTRSLRDLAASHAVDAIGLKPLDADDVAQLLNTIARVPDEPSGSALAARVVQHTAGVPLYVLELLKALHDGGHLAVQEGTWVI
ncbi:MAG: AAA family ATPase, partial [Gemmatimonadetes bacterium]|nr:AAA family ATPase [Gemmatimonadota bacterium]